jgi:predicted TIM-barrel fold metal-dependent hydrolase
MDLFETHRVIDVDTHITEPANVWTDRMSSKWGTLIPHIKRVRGFDVWFIGDTGVLRPGGVSMAGYNGTMPDHPLTYAEIPKATYDAQARIRHMDESGIYAQVIYPNLISMLTPFFLEHEEPPFILECLKAYNDFLVDWCSANPNRLIPVMTLPIWDLDASIAEAKRCVASGHKAILFPSQPQGFGLPALSHTHWDPIWAIAQEAQLSISFHIGDQEDSELRTDGSDMGIRANFARFSSLMFVENSKGMAEIIFGGVCHRFPDLNFVSVESGAAWIPWLMQAFDWQWTNSGVNKEHPEFKLLPSEYFERQIYASFWFEKEMLQPAIKKYPNNILYETDYPHATSMSPGPQSTAQPPREYAQQVLEGLPTDHLRKLLHENAAKISHID